MRSDADRIQGNLAVALGWKPNPYEDWDYFYGDNREEVSEWLIKVENAAYINAIPTEDVVPLLLHTLKGNAFHTAVRLSLSSGKKKISWEEYKEEFFASTSELDTQYLNFRWISKWRQ